MSRGLPNDVMLNAYPDSIGGRLAGSVDLLARPEIVGAFSQFYILPTFFNSDLDRGFSIIDYGVNADLVGPEDLAALDSLDIALKFDLVLNHLSVGSPQFRDLIEHGAESEYADFFIDWDEFWAGHGTVSDAGHVCPTRSTSTGCSCASRVSRSSRSRFPTASIGTTGTRSTNR